MDLPRALTIAGSDSGGGAGVQADLKTFSAQGVYGASVITAVTVQNTQTVSGVHDIPTDIVAAQIDAVFSDIRIDAVKIGMLSSAEIIHVIAERLRHWQPRFLVLDPVMVSKSGCKLLQDSAIDALRAELLPLATIITPNIPEAEVLFGAEIGDAKAQEEAASAIARATGVAVLVKGGHGSNDANDVLGRPDGSAAWFNGERVDTRNTHGTGCTLSSAIACGLARGFSLEESIAQAKRYLTGALAAGLDLGRGSGPMDHMWQLSQ